MILKNLNRVKMNTKLLKKVIMACLFISPITTIYADTISEAHQQTQRYINQQKNVQEKINSYQADYDSKLEYERNQRTTANKARIPTQHDLNKLATLMNSDDAKNAVNYMENLQPDLPQPRQVDRVEMEGFDTNRYGQRDNGVTYKYGNGGGVNEKELFPLNLPRQQ